MRCWSADDVHHHLQCVPLFNSIVVLMQRRVDADSGSCPRERMSLADALHAHNMDGNALLDLTQEDLMSHFGVRQLGTAKSVIRTISDLLDPCMTPLESIELVDDPVLAPAATRIAWDVTSHVDRESERLAAGDDSSAAPPRVFCAATSPSFKHLSALDPLSEDREAQQKSRPASAGDRRLHSLMMLSAQRRQKLFHRDGVANETLVAKRSSEYAVAEAVATSTQSAPRGTIRIADRQAPSNAEPVLLNTAPPRDPDISGISPVRNDAKCNNNDEVDGGVGDSAGRCEGERVGAPSTLGPPGRDACERVITMGRRTETVGILEQERRYKSITDLHATLAVAFPDGVNLRWLVNMCGEVTKWDSIALEDMATHFYNTVTEARAALKKKRHRHHKRPVPALVESAKSAEGQEERDADEPPHPDEPPHAEEPAAQPARASRIVSISEDAHENEEQQDAKDVAESQAPPTVAQCDSKPPRPTATIAPTTTKGDGRSLREKQEALLLTVDEFRTIMLSVVSSMSSTEYDHAMEYIDTTYGGEKLEQVRRQSAAHSLFVKWDLARRGFIPFEQLFQVLQQYNEKEKRRLTEQGRAQDIAAPTQLAKGAMIHPTLGVLRIGVTRRRPASGERSTAGASLASSATSMASLDRRSGSRVGRSTVGSGFDVESFIGFVEDETRQSTSEEFDRQMYALRTLVDEQLANEQGLGSLKLTADDIQDKYLPRTSTFRPFLLLYSTAIDPTTMVEAVFEQCRVREREWSSRHVSASIIGVAPPLKQKKLHIFTAGSDASESEALQCIEKNGITRGHWVYVSFPPEAISPPACPPVDEDSSGVSRLDDDLRSVSSLISLSTSASAAYSVTSSSGKTKFNGRMNVFLRRLALCVATRATALVHERFRLFCHCPIDFVDANNIPQVARSVAFIGSLLRPCQGEGDATEAIDNLVPSPQRVRARREPVEE